MSRRAVRLEARPTGSARLDALQVSCEQLRIKMEVPPTTDPATGLSRYDLTMPVPGLEKLPQAGLRWDLTIKVSGSPEHLVLADVTPSLICADPHSGLEVEIAQTGEVCLMEFSVQSLVDDVELSEDGLRLQGRSWNERWGAPRLALVGGGSLVAADVTWDSATGSFSAQFPAASLHAPGTPTKSWGVLELDPSMSGPEIVLTGAQLVRWTAAATRRTPIDWIGPQGRLRLSRTSRGQVWVRRDPPLAFGDRSAHGTRKTLSLLEARIHAAPRELTTRWLFESYGGRYCTDSVAAIDLRLRSENPHVKSVWGVRDSNVAVPQGTTAVLRDSPEYVAALHEADVLVNNANFPHYFRKQNHQFYLQTWHGTPLKKIGQDMPTDNLSLSYRALMKREGPAWDLLLAQNHYAAEILPRALAFCGKTLTVGYPRNDSLKSAGSRDRRERTRQRLGIPEGSLVVLYAPTWRESERSSMGYRLTQFLDYGWANARLGEEVLFLTRGHSNTSHSSRGAPQHVRDVSDYPEINDLYLAADLLITDYSSVMFDFVVTGKPIAFLVPDLDKYRDVTRGLYLDLEEVAPGPLLMNTDEVVQWIKLVQKHSDVHPNYSEFLSRFAPADDGAATERVLAELRSATAINAASS